MSKFLVVLALFVTLSARAEDQLPPEVQKLAENFHKTMMKCPEKIWSNYKWDGIKVVLMYPSKINSWVWDASTNSIQAIPNRDLPDSAIGSTYDFFELNGQKSISLHLEEAHAEVFKLGVHELFHHIGQENWSHNHRGRGTSYPLSGEPRFYRRMIYDNLKQYLHSGSQTNLRRAKYWFYKWSSEFSDETQSTTDGYEGTAEYVETMASAVAKLGCSASDEDIKAVVNEVIASKFGFSVAGQYLALDFEGYEIGGLAALVLRFSGTELLDWNKRMAAGETPLQVLFERVVPQVEPTPEALRYKFLQTAQRVNEGLKPLLDNDIKNWTNRAYVRVTAPHNWLQSNLMPKFFTRSSELNMELYPLSTEHHYVSHNDEGSDFRLQPNAIIFNHYTKVCPNQFSFTLVPEQFVRQEEGPNTLATDSVVGRLVGEIKVDEQGFKFFCLK